MLSPRYKGGEACPPCSNPGCHLHKVNLLKGSAPRVWAPSSPSQSAPPLPQQTLLIVASKRTIPGPVENGVSDPRQAPRRATAESIWELLLVYKPLPRPVLNEALPAPQPRPSLCPGFTPSATLKGPQQQLQPRGPLIHPLPLEHLFQELTAQHPPDPPMSTGSPMALHNPEPGSMKCTSRVKARQVCLEQSCHQDYLVH